MKACLSYCSEPAIIIRKPPVISTIPKSLCCAASAESLASSESFQGVDSGAAPNRLEVSEACVESDIKCQTTNNMEPRQKEETQCGDFAASSYSASLLQESSEQKENVVTQQKDDDHSIALGQIELVPLSPLHIDSTLFEAGESLDLVKYTRKASASADSESSLLFGDSRAACADCSQLIDALDIQSPVAFRLDSSITVQSTPFSQREQTEGLNTLPKFKEPSSEKFFKPASQHGVKLFPIEPCQMTVADHVQRFNMLALSSPKAKAQIPMKFQRTPVRQSVRRFNSLNPRKDTRSGWCATGQGSSMTKAVCLERGHSNEVQQQPQPSEVLCSPDDHEVSLKPKLPVSAQKSDNCRHCALGDVTNTMEAKGSGSSLAPKCAISEVAKSVLLQGAEKGYRGSPKNPLTHCMLLTAMQPIDL